MSVCTFCNKSFACKSNLNRHILTCKIKIESDNQKHIQNQLHQLQQQHDIEIESFRSQLQTQQQQHEIEIQNLQAQLNEQKEIIKIYQNQIFEIAKQPTNNITHNTTKTTNNNQKTLNMINQLAPYDLTTERVQEILDNYTHLLEKVFGNGPNGIADFIVEKILFDSETQKPKLVATDRSRGVFKYKDSDGNVHIDHKLKKTTDILQKPLLQANDQVFTEIYERQDRELDDLLRNTFSENSDLLNCINKHKLSAQLSRRLDNEFSQDDDLNNNVPF
jgi:hypothetical protein